MSKGEQTKLRITAEAAKVFNSKGYSQSSLQDIMEATQLKKGGIYRYFASKDELALAAFDFAYNRLKKRYRDEVFRLTDAQKRLIAVLELHGSLLGDPYLEGGCPIQNTAVEADDTHPELKQRARCAMDEWRHTIKMIIQKGVSRQEIKAVDAEQLGAVMIASLEGAVMLAKLYADKTYIRRIIDHLKAHIESLTIKE
ncbi:MAG: TetR/AcrR family transcriptional regulator [Trueperaceae bacterium]|nr:TetR/AcrR family transcriptional regulator [Trueperaceae bacterium]